MCKQRATNRWQALDKGYNFALNLITIRGLHVKLCASKVAGVLVVGILGLPFGSPETKNYLDVAPMESYKVYYKGEGGGFPQVRAMVSLVCSSCPWFVLAPKVFKLCTNHHVLICVGPYEYLRLVNSSYSRPKAPTCPSTPLKCCELGNVP
jgi:hypothetical protein